MITVSHNAQSATPAMVLGFDWVSESNNVIHQIIGQPVPAITFRPGGLRTGVLSYLCLSLDEALALEAMHREIGTFTVSDSDIPGANLSYVPVGQIRTALDPETRLRWTVDVGFQEVLS